ncbi:MAG TPA: hypothetical protein VIX12_09060, partial [Candidatus Binataceae bacterium]
DPVSQSGFARELGVPPSSLDPIVEGLKRGGFIVESNADAGARESGLFMVRDPATVSLEEAMSSVRDDDTGSRSDPRIEHVMNRLDAAERDVLRSMTVKDLLAAKSSESGEKAAIAAQPAPARS